MSKVYLIAADKPLPLCDFQENRTKTVTIPNGKRFRVTAPAGFQIQEHSYYRYEVDKLDLVMKPYQFELSLEADASDLLHLREYLVENFSAGEEVELWNLWVGVDRDDRVFRYHGELFDFDMESLEQFLEDVLENGKFSQIQMTITI